MLSRWSTRDVFYSESFLFPPALCLWVEMRVLTHRGHASQTQNLFLHTSQPHPETLELHVNDALSQHPLSFQHPPSVPKCLINDGVVNRRKMPPNGSDERESGIIFRTPQGALIPHSANPPLSTLYSHLSTPTVPWNSLCGKTDPSPPHTPSFPPVPLASLSLSKKVSVKAADRSKRLEVGGHSVKILWVKPDQIVHS